MVAKGLMLQECGLRTYTFWPISNDTKICSYTELTVNNYQEQRIIYNVVAKLYGSIEPG